MDPVSKRQFLRYRQKAAHQKHQFASRGSSPLWLQAFPSLLNVETNMKRDSLYPSFAVLVAFNHIYDFVMKVDMCNSFFL